MNSMKRISRFAIMSVIISSLLANAILLASCSSTNSWNNNAESRQEANEEETPGENDSITIIEHIEENIDTDQTDAEVENESIEDVMSIEDLPSLEEAEKETGIFDEDAGILYVPEEIIVVLPSGSKVENIDNQLRFCEFIEESSLSKDMLISGSIDRGKTIKGPTGEIVMLIHITDDATIPQAIAALKHSKPLKKAMPNYIMQAL